MKISEPIPCDQHEHCCKFAVNEGEFTHVSSSDVDIVKSCQSINLAIRRGGRRYAQVRTASGDSAYLHRLIMGLPDRPVDHIHHNGLDNRRSELRVLSHSKNILNRKGATAKSKSGFVGVFMSRQGKWRAQITVEWKTRSLGTFDTPEEAHAAHEAAKNLAINGGVNESVSRSL